MASDKVNRFVLDPVFEEDSCLIAIYSSSEIFRIVYHINRVFGLSLKRTAKDVDLQTSDAVIFYPLYHFFDQTSDMNYYFIANKGNAIAKPRKNQNLLFQEENVYHTYLIPERKSVDFFFKIDNGYLDDDFLEKLKQIKEINTLQSVDIQGIKSYNNLIFD